LQKKLHIIIPAYNEQNSIVKTIENLKEIKPELNKLGYGPYIFVVDDGSTDQTAELARDSGADKIIKHKTNIGLGAAVRSGFLAARKSGADIAIKFDADLQHSPLDIISLIQPIINDEAEIVYGNRFDKIDYKMPMIRKIGNSAFTFLMRKLTHWPLKDSQPGILAVSRDYLKVFSLPGDYNYTQQILLDAYHQGMRFAHKSVSFSARKTGESFISFMYPFKVLPQLLMVIVGIKPMKIFFPMGLLFLFFATTIFSIEFTMWLLDKTHKPVLHVNFVMGLSFFGLQTIFFGLLEELIVRTNKK
jgi:glycosyltransferase involved in cell wall biosynthesis